MSTTGSAAASVSQLDVVFDGTWVIVPRVDGNNNIAGVDIFSPACGHPLGVYFANELDPNPWPQPTGFYMLDPHSYTLSIQRGSRAPAGMAIASINQSVNHCLEIKRPIASNWDLLLSINAGPDKWTSGDTIVPQTSDAHGNTVNCFRGQDSPTGKISSLQTLSFTGVNAVALSGAPATVQGLFPAPWSGNGSLIFEDEIPYIPTLQHERSAIFAMANLAGLDLALDYPLPAPPVPPAPAASGRIRQRLHTGGPCGHSLIVMP
jgi:hypothetical protein